jgi:hypothetical protein
MNLLDMEQDLIEYADAEKWGGDASLVEIKFEGDRIWGLIPIERITNVYDPFAEPPWYDGSAVCIAGVRSAIKENRLNPEPYSAKKFGPDWTSRKHEERIAWLVLNPSHDPISIEFSYPNDDAFSIDDGNHRLAAAIYRGDREIAVEVGGFFENTVSALGVICRPLQLINVGSLTL